MGNLKEKWMSIWGGFEEKHPKLAKWVYQIFYFFVFSMGVTVFQYLVFTFMPGILGIGLAGTEFMWPQKEMHLFGVDFTWSLLGYNVLRDANGAVMIGGGLGYFISYETGSFLAQCINFPLQRNITFKSKGNPFYQAMWYFIASPASSSSISAPRKLSITAPRAQRKPRLRLRQRVLFSSMHTMLRSRSFSTLTASRPTSCRSRIPASSSRAMQ